MNVRASASGSSPALVAKTAVLEETLARIARDYAPAAFSSSLSIEDMVITDVILSRHLDLEIFTLDTERLHQDTLAVIDAIEHRYGKRIRVMKPNPQAVAEYLTAYGLNAFYESVELRQRCCGIRKVEPLKRALAGKKAWVTGQRRTQSVTRAVLPAQEYDEVHGIEKFNPLADWSEDEVWAYIRAHDVPYNRLYDQGYRSIGCAPCTRPVTAGEDVRAGRWWWEQPESRECGLNVAPDGRLIRAKTAGKVTA